MNEFKPEISLLYQAAFGIPAKLITYPGAANALESGNTPDISFSGLQVVEKPEAERYSGLGTPVIFPITFKGKTYKRLNKRSEVVEVTMRDFLLPAASITEFDRAKIMGKTTVSGGYGSVKETYGFDDWQIKIRGFCLADSGHPQATTAMGQQDLINQWENLTDSIEVDGELFENKGISNLVIEDIKWKSIPGKPWVIPFEMSCVSDEPIELLV